LGDERNSSPVGPLSWQPLNYRCQQQYPVSKLRVRFTLKADMNVSGLLSCKLTPEPHFASRKSLLIVDAIGVVVRRWEGHATTRFH
jgi:hypothetical protein